MQGKLTRVEQTNCMMNTYENVSGQRLNQDKTLTPFSNNTSKESIDTILSILGIISTLSYEKYLGLQAIIGRSRSQAFKSILDKVRRRINNRKMKFFSQADKKFMLKPVF